MSKEKCFNELYEERGQHDDWYLGGCCKGRSCEQYGKCKGGIEFDKLPKRAPTDYELDEAVRRERSLYKNY